MQVSSEMGRLLLWKVLAKECYNVLVQGPHAISKLPCLSKIPIGDDL